MSALFISLSAAAALMRPTATWANHPVLVEGNCNNPPAGNPAPVTPGQCGDYDGDGLIGTAEDADGDRVFGTINGANAATATGVNNNGTITIVTSGTFAEQVTLTGNVTLQAASGVDANIDAILQGDPNSPTRETTPGIIVNAPSNRRVVIRNVGTCNWTNGIQVNGDSNVTIDRVRAEHNVNYGIEVNGNAAVRSIIVKSRRQVSEWIPLGSIFLRRAPLIPASGSRSKVPRAARFTELKSSAASVPRSPTLRVGESGRPLFLCSTISPVSPRPANRPTVAPIPVTNHLKRA